MVMDRTNELLSFMDSSDMKDKTPLINPLPINSHNNAIQRTQEFNSQVKQIANFLTLTFTKLENLTQLTRESTVSNDRFGEIQSLIGNIKNDIDILNKGINTIQSARDTPRTNKQMGEHANFIVQKLRKDLARVSNSFKGILESRTANLKKMANRRNVYSNLNMESIPSTSNFQDLMQTSVFFEHEKKDDQADEEFPGKIQTRLQQQMSIIDQSEVYYKSRADTMKNIESTIVELSQIFQNLATLVHEQDENIQRIDGNLEAATLSIEAGHSELTKYLTSLNSNRWLMLKIFAILFVFFLFFVLFMA